MEGWKNLNTKVYKICSKSKSKPKKKTWIKYMTYDDIHDLFEKIYPNRHEMFIIKTIQTFMETKFFKGETRDYYIIGVSVMTLDENYNIEHKGLG